MFYYFFLLIGILLIILDVPILIKILQTKGTAVDLKRQYKVVGMVFLIGIAFIGCAFLAKADNTNNKNKQAVLNSVSKEITNTPIWDGLIINPIVIDDLTFNLADNYTIEWSLWVNEYIEKFLVFSPEILENKSEIEYAECQILSIQETDPWYQELGWTKTIQIKIKIKNDTALPHDWEIAGAELLYYLGSGRIPGCMIQTKQALLFSGCLDEEIGLFIDNSFRGIDEIKPYTFKKKTPQITASNFKQIFQEKFINFGGRQLNSWSGTKLAIENNLDLQLLIVEDDGTLLWIQLKHDDVTKPLQYENDFYIALCAMISIAEPYLEKYQVEQFATTLEDTKPYLVEYQIKEGINTVTQGYWLPSGNNYNIGLRNNSFYVSVSFEVEE